jgi:NAD(P)-dependent dehydrogenase (short-subunit alcohol dehydrogenase family)
MIKAIVTGHSAGLGAALTAELLGRGIPVLGRPGAPSHFRQTPAWTPCNSTPSTFPACRPWVSGWPARRAGHFLADARHALLINNAGMLQPVGPCGGQDAARSRRPCSSTWCPAAAANAFVAASAH